MVTRLVGIKSAEGDDLMDSARFNELAKRGADMLLAAKMTGRLIAYEGTLQGHEVVVLGAHWPEDAGRNDTGFSAKPICLLIDEDVFDMLNVDGKKVHLVADS